MFGPAIVGLRVCFFFFLLLLSFNFAQTAATLMSRRLISEDLQRWIQKTMPGGASVCAGAGARRRINIRLAQPGSGGSPGNAANVIFLVGDIKKLVSEVFYCPSSHPRSRSFPY